MITAWLISALGLVAGACLGLALAFRPRWAARLIRMESAPEEQRIVVGAAMLAAHAAPLLFLAANIGYRDALLGAVNAGAAAAVGAAWLGAATGRLFALWRAKRLAQWRACGFEAALGLVIAAPWFFWIGVALAG